MGKTKNGRRYPEELRARAVRMVLDHEKEYRSRSAAILPISQKVGCSRDSLRIWVKQHETDTGQRDGLTTLERDRIKELERENRQLRQANEILKKASALTSSLEPVAFLRSTLLRRSSTAHSANDCVHQGQQGASRGRADLPSSANRPINVL